MSGWTFLTNHAQVFLSIAENSRLSARAIAAKVGVTERAVQRILDDLEEAGYISRFREGRNNYYEIHAERPLRHPAQHGLAVSSLMALLGSEASQGREQVEA